MAGDPVNSARLPGPPAPQLSAVHAGHVPWKCGSQGPGVAPGYVQTTLAGSGDPEGLATRWPGCGHAGQQSLCSALSLPPEMPTELCCTLVLPWFGIQHQAGGQDTLHARGQGGQVAELLVAGPRGVSVDPEKSGTWCWLSLEALGTCLEG